MTLAPLPHDHDLAHLHRALRYVTDWSIAVDGGACTGIWTAVMADRFGHVHAFEPVPENARHIPAAPNVTLHPVALADLPRSLWMVPGPENVGQWHRATTDDGPQAALEVRAVPLDTLDLPACGLLKLDVEGMELHALRGAAITIATHRPVLVLEENGLCERYGYTAPEMHAWLRERGYHRAVRLNKDEVWTPEAVERAA